MHDKILLNVIKTDNSLTYNATAKAREDVERTLVNEDYKVINVPYYVNRNKYIAPLIHLKDCLRTVRQLKRNKPQEIIIQYPGFRIGTRSIDLLTKLLKDENVTVLIHDLDTLRVFGKLSEREKSILNRAKKVIVHTEAMKNHLMENGVTTPMNIMWLFDYYGNGEIKKPATDSVRKTIVFAGNINKSEFLRKIDSLQGIDKFYLYGLSIDYHWPASIEYKGKFSPDEIGDIEGTWGLVWDGDSTQTCSGKMGNYLRYNSSHKVSLYIASGRPVILWSQSGIAPFIKRNKLGICVDSLDDIPKILDRMTDQQFDEIIESVGKMQLKLRKGEMLRTVLS